MRFASLASALLVSGLVAACGTDLYPARDPLGSTASSSPGDAGSPTSATGADGGAPTETPADAWGEVVANGWPCDVRAVLEADCARCHTGETYALWYTKPDDWKMPVGSGMTLGQFAVTRMQDTVSPMPPAYDTGSRPTPADIDLVAAWVAAGMPYGTCGPLTPPQ